MNESLTKGDFLQYMDTFAVVLNRNLNNRFEHYEKRAILREERIIESFTEIISSVNSHTDERFNEVHEKFDGIEEKFKMVEVRFNAVEERMVGLSIQIGTLTSFVARKYNIPTNEITG